MYRFFISILLAGIFWVHAASAERLVETNPPPLELRSLAEQIAPLLNSDTNLPKPPLLRKKVKSKTDEFSMLEESFSQRAGQKLKLFGYDQIGRDVSEAPADGEIQDDVVLGPGDRILITFRGQRDDSKTYVITPQGQLIIDGLDPVAASGLTIGGLRALLEEETSRNLLNTTLFVSVKSLRQITVTVMGEVKRPGVYTLGPLQNVLDALAKAKGINGNGTLRHVRLIRSGKMITLDFYKLLLAGDLGASIALRSGDKIMVPLLEHTIAVAGDVRRPAILSAKTVTRLLPLKKPCCWRAAFASRAQTVSSNYP